MCYFNITITTNTLFLINRLNLRVVYFNELVLPEYYVNLIFNTDTILWKNLQLNFTKVLYVKDHNFFVDKN